jgi:hypothetical protein
MGSQTNAEIVSINDNSDSSWLTADDDRFEVVN